MPKILTYEQLGQRPEPSPQGGVVGYRANTGNEELAGQSLSSMGEVLDRAMKQEIERNDTTKVEDAYNKYRGIALEQTAGEKGLLRTKGADAINGDLLKTLDANLSTRRKAIEEGLSSDTQRARFKSRADQTDYAARHQVLDHLTQQQTVYANIVQDGRVAAAQTEVVAQPLNSEVFNGAWIDLKGKSEAYLNSQGIKDEGARQKYLNTLEDTLKTRRIDALLYATPEIAEAKFRGLADTLHNPELRLTYQARTREVALAVVSGKDADVAISETRQAPPKAALKSFEGDAAATLLQINNTLKQKGRENDPDLIEAKYVLENGIVAEPNTSGLPNSRDIAAQLPLALARVTKMADARYGKDAGNPDRMAYIAKTQAAVTAKISSEVHQLAAVQEQSAGLLLDAVGGVGTAGQGQGKMATVGGAAAQGSGRTKMTSFSQIQADPALMAAYQKLDYKQKVVVNNAIDSNAKTTDHGDSTLYNELRNRIVLPPTDPNKINWVQSIYQDPRVQAGRLNITQLNSLRTTLDQDATDDGRSQQARVKAGANLVRADFDGDTLLTMAGTQKGNAARALELWQMNADRVIGLYKQQNWDIRPLFDPTPGNKESLVTPEALAPFKVMSGGAPTSAAALSAAAANVKTTETAPPVDQPATIETREQLNAWLATLPETARTFKAPDGNVYNVPARSQANSAPQDAGNGPVAAPAAIPGRITLGPDGELRQTPAADANGDKPAVVIAPKLPEDDIPTLVEGPTAPKGARTEEQKIAAAARLQDYMEGAIKTGLWLLTGPVQAVRLVKTAAGEFIQQVKKLSPTEEERAVTGFRSLVKNGTFRANEDTVVLLNNFLASKKGTDVENVKAQKMLKVIGDKLGIDTAPLQAPDKRSDAGGVMRGVMDFLVPSAAAAGMSKAEAEAAAKSGIFDDNDRAQAGIGKFKPAAPASGAPATPAGYKTSTDDARNTGKSTKAQDEKFIELMMRTGMSRKVAEAELARKKGGR